MASKRVDRRSFLRTAATSALTGFTVTGSSLNLRADSAQAIWNRNTEEANTHRYPGEKEADIWVFSGQSNSQGWGMLKAPVEPDPRILFFDADNRWVIAREPLNPRFASWMPDPVHQNILLQRQGVDYPSGASAESFLEQMKQEKVTLGGVGPGMAFAKQLVRFVDRPIGLMYCGVGGSPIKSWDPTLKGSNYEAMIRRIAIVGGKVKGLVWYQGESDAMTSGAEEVYEAALLQLFDSVRKDTGMSELPILCVQLGRFVWNYDTHARGFEKIRDIQRRIPELRPKVYAVSALDLPLEDAAHISFEGHQRLGRRLAEVALSEVYEQRDHGKCIRVETVKVLQPESRRPMVRVRFNGVSGRLSAAGLPTGFELRSQLPLREPQPTTAELAMHVIYRVDFDPTDGSAVILGAFDNALINSGGAKFHPLEQPFSIVYGGGMSPYVNIVDENDMAVPAFGPLQVKVH